MLPGSNLIHTKIIHIVDRCPQSHNTFYIGRSCFKLEGKLIEDCVIEVDIFDHLPAHLVRR